MSEKPIKELLGRKVKSPAGHIGIIVSVWQQGIWLGADDAFEPRFPLFIDGIQNVFTWEITEEPTNLASFDKQYGFLRLEKL